MKTDRGQRTILILAPTGRDADTLGALLAARNLPHAVRSNLADLAQAIDDEAGLALITEEAVAGQDTAPLAAALEAQPAWSDLPFVLLFSRGRTALSGLLDRLPKRATNVVLLERPLATESLLSAIRWSLTARQRQYVVRDQLRDLASQAALLGENERALEESRAYLGDVLDSAQEAFVAIDCDGRLTVCNAAFRRLLRLAPDAGVIGARLDSLVSHLRADGRDYGAEDCPVLVAARCGTAAQSDAERFRLLDGTVIPVEYRAQPVHRQGRLVGAVCTATDITERLRVAEALRESDRELRIIANSLPFLIAFIDRTQTYRFINEASREWVGLSPEQIIGRTVREIVGEDGYGVRAEAIRKALTGEESVLRLSWPHAQGARRQAEARYMPRREEGGTVSGFHVFVRDVTEQAEAAEALERRVAERTEALRRQIVEREAAEAALRQAQKMEAVGQLTGGIAHDFNNILTGIIGSLDLMRRRIESGRSDGLDRFMEAAGASARRAASLTHRLLAFSRRQPLDPRAVDVNALVASLTDLLTRTIGEQVRLRCDLAGDLPPAHADANQLENALLNLVINARDAMVSGGDLLIRTELLRLPAEPPAGDRDEAEALAAGDYVALEVSDTGVGMTESVLARVFEPFFTTKPLGQGTGLGLSMIYGFARQSGGSVRIRSQPGRGTNVRLLLPVASLRAGKAGAEGSANAPVWDDQGSGAAAAGVASRADAGSGESVLLVEDDPAVRLLVREVLDELGYRAIEAADATAALPTLASPARIDLLVSDVGLPGMNGRALAERARSLRPGLRVLLMTGYAEEAADPDGFLGEGMQMITKPFALKALGQRIRAMIAHP